MQQAVAQVEELLVVAPAKLAEGCPARADQCQEPARGHPCRDNPRLGKEAPPGNQVALDPDKVCREERHTTRFNQNTRVRLDRAIAGYGLQLLTRIKHARDAIRVGRLSILARSIDDGRDRMNERLLFRVYILVVLIGSNFLRVNWGWFEL